MTAVDWLEEELAKNLKTIVVNQDYKLMEHLFDEARKREKQQIIDAFDCDGSPEPGEVWISNGVQYYDQTYK